MVSNALSEGFVTLSIRLDVSDGRTLAWLSKVGEVISKQFHDDHVEIHVRLPARQAGRLRHEGHDFQVLDADAAKFAPELPRPEPSLPTTRSVSPLTAPSSTTSVDEDVA
jgi:hypothetical protein